MRKQKRHGVRSLAEVATLPMSAAPQGDPGLRYNGLKRFQQEEAVREHQENLALHWLAVSLGHGLCET